MLVRLCTPGVSIRRLLSWHPFFMYRNQLAFGTAIGYGASGLELHPLQIVADHLGSDGELIAQRIEDFHQGGKLRVAIGRECLIEAVQAQSRRLCHPRNALMSLHDTA